MASNADNRVVQMQFENSQFERNIAKSKKSLQDFKEALRFEETTQGMKQFFHSLNNIDISGLVNNIERIADKFTGLGHISEMVLTTIQSKMRSVIASISSFADSMTTEQISAGKAKYETLNKSVQTIMAATGRSEQEVYQVMKRLNEYTDQTSYNFADMAQNIGKFTSVGISLEDAEKQMEGIANWAARSGAGIAEASRAMYNLSQAMGVGKMTLIDWKSIENAGMATREFKQQLIESAVAAGTLEKTVKKVKGSADQVTYKTAKSLGKQVEVTADNVGSTLNKDWATSAVVSATLNKYYWDDLYYEGTEAIVKLTDEQKKAFDEMWKDDKFSAKEWKTLESYGVLTQDVKQKILDLAVTQGKLAKSTDKAGKTIYTYVSKTGQKTKITLDNIGQTISKGWFTKDLADAVTGINELAKSSYEAAQKCTTFTDVIGAWKDMISTGWMTSFKHIFGDLTESMEFFSNVCNKVSDDLSTLIEFRNTLLEKWAGNGGRADLFSIILGDYGEDVETGAYGLLDIFHDVGKLISDGFWSMIKIFAGDEIGAIWDEDDGNWRVAWLTLQLEKFTTSIKNFLAGVRNFFTEEVNIGGQATTRLEVIQNVVNGFVGAMVIASDIIGGIVAFFVEIGNQLSPSFQAIEYMFSTIGDSIYKSAGMEHKDQGILGFFLHLAELTRPLTNSINEIVGSLVGLIMRVIQWGNETGVFDKISKGLTNLYHTVVKIATPIATFLGHVIETITNLFDEGFTKDSILNAGKTIGGYFKGMIADLIMLLPQSMNGLKSALFDLFGFGNDGLLARLEVDNKDNIFVKIHDFFADGIGKIKEFVSGGKLSEIWQKLKDGLGIGAEGLWSVISGIIDWFSKLSLGDAIRGTVGGFLDVAGWLISHLRDHSLFDIIKAVLGVISAVKLFKLLRDATSVVGTVREFFENPLAKLKSWITGNDDDGGFDVSAITDKILDVAKAIALIAGAVVVLGAIPTGNLVKGILALAGILGVMAGFMAILNKVSGKGFESIGTFVGMAALAISIGLLVAALLPLSIVSWEGLGKMMAGLAGILGQMLIFMAIAKHAQLYTDVHLAGFIGFAFSIALLVTSLLPLAAISWEGYGKMMAGLGGVLAQLLIVMAILKHTEMDMSILGGFIGFAASIAILVLSLLPLTLVSWEGYGKMMAGLGGVLAQLIIAMAIIKKARIKVDKQLAGFIGFAASIAILVLSLLPLANVTWEGYGKMMAGLGGVLVQLFIFSLLMKKLSVSPIAMVGAIAFAGAFAVMMLAFGAALALAKGIDWGTIIAFSVGITAIMLGMSVAIGALGALPTGVLVKGILAIAAAIIVIIGAISLMIPILAGAIGDGVQSVAGRLRLAGDLISQFTETMNGIGDGEIDDAQSKFDKIKKLMMSLKDFAGMEKNVEGFVVAMWSLSSGLAVAYKEFNQIGDIDTLAVFDLVKEIKNNYDGIDKLTNLNLHQLQTNLAGLGGAMMLYAMGAEQVAEAEGKSLKNGVNEEAITAAVKIMHKIAETMVQDGEFVIPSMPSSTELSDWGVQLAALAGALVSFENAGAGLGDGTDKALETLTFFQQLKAKLKETSFAKNMKWVLEYMRGSKSKSGESEEADVLVSFGSHISRLGEAMLSFANSTSRVNAETGEIEPIDYTKAVEALQAFLDIKGKLPNVSGIVQWVTGRQKDLVDLGTEIESLGRSLSAFSNKLAGKDEGGNKFDPETVKTATKAMEDIYTSIGKINEKLPKIGGVLMFFKILWGGRNWTGEDIGTDIGGLGDGLAKLATGLSGFATSTNGAGFDKKSVDTATTVVTQMQEAIIELNKKLPKIGGAGSTFKKWWEGRDWSGEDIGNDIGGLGDGLAKLGTGLNKFAEKTNGSGYNPASVGLATEAMDSMITYMQTAKGKLPVIGGIANAFSEFINGHSMTMAELGTQIGALGEGLGNLGTGINKGKWTTASTESATEAFKVLDLIMDVSLKLSELAASSAATSSSPMVWMDNLYYMMDQISGFHELLTGDSAGYTPKHSIVEGLVSFMNQLEDALDGVGPDIEKLKSLTLVSEILQHLSNVDTSVDLKTVGRMITNGTADGIKDGTANVISAGATMLVNVYNSMTGEDALDFKPIGESIATGIGAGISSEESEKYVTDAIKALMAAAYNAGAESIDMGSPSRLFAIMGGFISQGLAMGIRNDIGYVTDASTFMGEAAIDSTAGVLSTLSSMLDEDLDVDPTISPVIDLSNFNSGMGSMQKAIDRSRMSIDTSVIGRYAMRNLPHRSTQEINQNGSDYSGLYSRIDQATERIDTLGEKIAKMKLVMDGDVVAGGVSDGVDRNLGRSMFYASRNN